MVTPYNKEIEQQIREKRHLVDYNVKEYPTIIFDVAHNINSLEIIFGELKKIKGLFFLQAK